MKKNDKDLNDNEYLLIHISKQFQTSKKPFNNKTSSHIRLKPAAAVTNSHEITNKELLLYEDIIKFSYIFEKANELELDKLLITDAAIESQKSFVDYIKEKSIDEKLKCINTMNKLISSIHANSSDYVIVKKYLILYYFSNNIYKRGIEAKLRKMKVILKHY